MLAELSADDAVTLDDLGVLAVCDVNSGDVSGEIVIPFLQTYQSFVQAVAVAAVLLAGAVVEPVFDVPVDGVVDAPAEADEPFTPETP